MTDPLVTPLTPAQVDAQVQEDLHESIGHRVLEMLDATIRSIYGPQDETISSGDAEDVLQNVSGVKGFLARLLDKGLNAVSPDHGEKALIADYIRAVMEQRRAAKFLDAQTVAVVDAALEKLP